MTTDAKLVTIGLVLYALLAGFYGGRFFEQRRISEVVGSEELDAPDFRPRPAFLRSVTIEELAERRCLVPTRTQREQILCHGDFLAGALQGLKYQKNIQSGDGEYK
jgi:hypothetical protein